MAGDDTSTFTLADVLRHIEASDLSKTRKRDLASAVNRISQMARVSPATTMAEASTLRAMVNAIRPALHDVSDKTWSNLRSNFVTPLEMAGVIQSMGRGTANADADWKPVTKAISNDKRLSCGLAAFANYCARNSITPEEVNDGIVADFAAHLEAKTLTPKPNDVARRVPKIWNEAATSVPGWPAIRLSVVSTRPPPKRVPWHDLSESFRLDAETYLANRADPDILSDDPNTPVRALAARTVRLQREQLQSAASVLIKLDAPVASLADLVAVDKYKAVLRHYNTAAGGEPNAYLDSLARTLIQVAKYHVTLPPEELAVLKRLKGKLKSAPFDLTEKNKTLLSQLESEKLRAKLMFLPEKLVHSVVADLKNDRLRFVQAQVALAIAILLSVPLRSHNLSALEWKRHFSEPDGPKGRLIVHISARETKTGRSDYVAEVPTETAGLIRWYRATILPRMKADPNGYLFVTKSGKLKSQETLSQQIVEAISDHVGVHMTPHQFRHFAAVLYLEDRPDDFETVRNLLGHAWGKTTSIYAGSGSRRASRAYGAALIEQREALRSHMIGRALPRGRFKDQSVDEHS